MSEFNTVDLESQKKTDGRWPIKAFLILASKVSERIAYFTIMFSIQNFFGTVYLTPDNLASLIKSIFGGLTFTCPLLGSYLSDSYFGKFRVTLFGSLLYILATALLCVSAYTEIMWLSIASILLCGMAAGGINAIASSFGADQFEEDQEKMRASFFGYLVFANNVAATLAIYGASLISDRFGYFWRFLIPLPFLICSISLLIFGTRKQGYRTRPTDKTLFKQVFTSISQIGDPTNDCARAFRKILSLFAFLPLFWAVWQIQYGQVVMQGARLLPVATAGGWINSEFSGTVSGLLIIMLVPCVNFVSAQLKLGIVSKMLIGMILQIIATAFLLVIEIMFANGYANLFWTQYLMFCLPSAIAEVFVSIAMYDYAYACAPETMKSVLVAFGILTQGLGSWISVPVEAIFSHTKADLTTQFYVYLALACVNTIAFACTFVRFTDKEEST